MNSTHLVAHDAHVKNYIDELKELHTSKVQKICQSNFNVAIIYKILIKIQKGSGSSTSTKGTIAVMKNTLGAKILITKGYQI